MAKVRTGILALWNMLKDIYSKRGPGERERVFNNGEELEFLRVFRVRKALRLKKR